MKIWLLNVGEPIPQDPGTPRLLRTGILAGVLAQRGHDVTWFNAAVDHQRKVLRHETTTTHETPEGYRLVLLAGRLYSRNISLNRIKSHRENAAAFREVCETLDPPDVIMCGLPTIELAAEAGRYAQRRNIPFIIDLRDMWPDIFTESAPSLLRPLLKPLLGKWERAARETIDQASSVTGITDAFVDWGLRKANRERGPLDRAFHLAVNPQNPPEASLEGARAFWAQQGVKHNSDRMIAVFMGTLSERLAFSTLIDGYKNLSDDEKSKLQLVLCGKGDLEDEIQDKANQESGIIFAGWRNAAELHVLKQMADFGLLPYKASSDFRMSYPNKVGEYLQASLPIVTSIKGVTQTLIDDNEIGLTYDENSSADATRVLRETIHAGRPSNATRARCVSVYKKMFDGEAIYSDMADHVETVAQNKLSGG